MNMAQARAMEEAIAKLPVLADRVVELSDALTARLDALDARIAELEQRKTLSLGAQRRG